MPVQSVLSEERTLTRLTFEALALTRMSCFFMPRSCWTQCESRATILAFESFFLLALGCSLFQFLDNLLAFHGIPRLLLLEAGLMGFSINLVTLGSIKRLIFSRNTLGTLPLNTVLNTGRFLVST